MGFWLPFATSLGFQPGGAATGTLTAAPVERDRRHAARRRGDPGALPLRDPVRRSRGRRASGRPDRSSPVGPDGIEETVAAGRMPVE